MDERSIIKVLALTGVYSSPSTRLRIIYMSEYLKKYGIDTTVIRYPKNIINFLSILKNNDYDVIWLQKRMPDFFKYLILKNNKKPIVFDFDDNLLVRMKPKNDSYRSRTREIKFSFIKNLSRGFTCGNKFLANFVKDTKKPYFVYPTPVPVDVPVKDIDSLNGEIKIGWLGLSGGFMYLDKILPDLIKLKNEINFKFIVISDRNYIKDIDFIENITWDIETQEKEISKFDIGIMPLSTDSPYDKGKCAYKILQYMASGVIPVGEAYGTNLEVIKDGENGFLVYNNNWYGKLKEVILKLKDKDFYRKISKNAIETAKQYYSFEAIVPELAKFLKSFK